MSYVTGIPGGIFAPTLAVGAGLGGQLHEWLPLIPSGAIVVLSMAAYFSGVVQAPLTALVIVMEMTDDRTLMLPLMAVALLARIVGAAVCSEPLYRSLASATCRRKSRRVLTGPRRSCRQAASDFASSRSSAAPSPRQALPCMQASTCGPSTAKRSSIAPVSGECA